MNRAAASTIAQAARDQHMRTLREDGWRKVQIGQTTLEEVLRVTQNEEHVRSLIGGDKGVVA
jgi:type II secretory ATPase GspE/PulE/Tfp pilus assembly ATPase PilB-like protein